MRYLSPLRYPGGKARLAPFFARIKWAQDGRLDAYAEPFAGGAGAALRLLADAHVERIFINDLNPGIAAFWRAATTAPDAFCDLIRNTPVTVDEWQRQHHTYDTADGDDLTLGFATFFLNRTNRSGILNGRPIGGLEQAGAWKIDARYNPDALCQRVAEVGRLAPRIAVSEMDAIDFLTGLGDSTTTLVYVDPPYIEQGDRLYFSRFAAQQHEELARTLATSTFPWILTYDAHDRVVEELYAGSRCAEFGITHSAQIQHLGSEYIVFSDRLRVPDLQVTRLNKGALLTL